MIEILSSERKDNKKGAWLVLKGKDEKGAERTWNVFDNTDFGKRIINELFRGPGKYDTESKKDGQYWSFVKFEMMMPAGTTQSGGTSRPAASAAPMLTTTAPAANRITIAAACVEAAGRVFQSSGEDRDVTDKVSLFLRVVMKECEAFIKGSATVPTNGAHAGAEGA